MTRVRILEDIMNANRNRKALPIMVGLLAVLGCGVAQAQGPSAEEEFAVPDSWVQGAKKEGKVVFYGSDRPTEIREVTRAFNRRYPFVQVDYLEASTEVRREKVLFAAKRGEAITDIIYNLGNLQDYIKSGVLMDLRDLPMWKRYPADLKQENFIGFHIKYWSLAYNRELIAERELPKTWEELLDPRWKGAIGVTRTANAVVFPQLWTIWGAEKTSAYMRKLFSANAQFRSEGTNAALKLMAAGEFKFAVPGQDYESFKAERKGLPVSWVALDPLPAAAGDIVILRAAPHPYATKLFLNWLLTREGQRSYAKTTSIGPAHPELRGEIIAYPEKIREKIKNGKVIMRTLGMVEKLLSRDSPLIKVWNEVTLKGL